MNNKLYITIALSLISSSLISAASTATLSQEEADKLFNKSLHQRRSASVKRGSMTKDMPSTTSTETSSMTTAAPETSVAPSEVTAAPATTTSKSPTANLKGLIEARRARTAY